MRPNPGTERATPLFPYLVLHQVGFAGPASYLTAGELLPRLSTLTASAETDTAVYLCCTFLRVTPTGRYPAPCPVELGLSSGNRNRGLLLCHVSPRPSDRLQYEKRTGCPKNCQFPQSPTFFLLITQSTWVNSLRILKYSCRFCIIDISLRKCPNSITAIPSSNASRTWW